MFSIMFKPAPLRPSGTSPNKLWEGDNLGTPLNFSRSPNLLGELSEGLSGHLCS
jgi:hypothetical protein